MKKLLLTFVLFFASQNMTCADNNESPINHNKELMTVLLKTLAAASGETAFTKFIHKTATTKKLKQVFIISILKRPINHFLSKFTKISPKNMNEMNNEANAAEHLLTKKEQKKYQYGNVLYTLTSFSTQYAQDIYLSKMLDSILSKNEYKAGKLLRFVLLLNVLLVSEKLAYIKFHKSIFSSPSLITRKAEFEREIEENRRTKENNRSGL